MLVTFSCDAYANITMFGDVAVRLLKLMGQSGTVPSALLAEDVPAALERLQTAIEADKAEADKVEATSNQSADEDDDERAVSFAHRALPLIELLTAAAKAKCNVMWDKNR